MKRKLKFFTYGLYISMVAWECGLIASMIVENVTMKILLILIPLAIYWFFIIGKSIIEEKIKKISQHRGKRNLKCALYKWRSDEAMAITMEDIIESNRVKDEAWNDYKESLKDKFTSEQLEKIKDAFYTAAQGYIFRRKEY